MLIRNPNFGQNYWQYTVINKKMFSEYSEKIAKKPKIQHLDRIFGEKLPKIEVNFHLGAIMQDGTGFLFV